jgi:hypothetical protein
LLKELEGNRAFPDALAAMVTVRGCAALLAPVGEPLLGWYDSMAKLLGADGLRGFADARGDLGTQTVDNRWTWETVKQAENPERSITAPLARWIAGVEDGGTVPVVENPPAPAGDDPPPAAVTVWEPQAATLERYRAGLVLWLGVGVPPVSLLSALEILQPLRVEVDAPGLDVQVVRHEYKSGKLERFNLGSGPDSHGPTLSRTVMAAALKMGGPGSPYDSDGAATARVGVVCQKSGWERMRESGTPEGARVATYGAGHAASNHLEGVELLLVAAYRVPASVYAVGAEIIRRACRIPWSGGDPDQTMIEAHRVALAAGLVDLTGRENRRAGPRGWDVAGWDDPQPWGSVPSDPLEAELLAWGQAATVANAVGRSRPADDGTPRCVLLLDGHAAAGVRPTGVVSLADVHETLGLPAPETEDPQAAGLVRENARRKEQGPAAPVLEAVDRLHQLYGHPPSERELRAELGTLGETLGRRALGRHRDAALVALGLEGDGLEVAFRAALDALETPGGMAHLRGGLMAHARGLGMGVAPGTLYRNVAAVLDALEAQTVPQATRTALRWRYQRLLEGALAVLGTVSQFGRAVLVDPLYNGPSEVRNPPVRLEGVIRATQPPLTDYLARSFALAHDHAKELGVLTAMATAPIGAYTAAQAAHLARFARQLEALRRVV